MEYLLPILSGGASGAMLTFLLRDWIFERLKRSINHAYDQKLESYRSELSLKIKSIEHDNNIKQLRTSLFFDHQRTVFSNILEATNKVQNDFLEHGVDKELGLIHGVPRSSYIDFCKEIKKYDLFINKEIGVTLALMQEALCTTLSFEKENGEKIEPDPNKGFEEFCFLYPRLVEILKNEIGIVKTDSAVIEVIAFAGVKILNKISLQEMDLPEKGVLKIEDKYDSLDVMQKGLANYDYLKTRLSELNTYLRNGGGIIGAERKSREILELMNKNKY